MAHQPWRSWFPETSQREAGRLIALTIGVALIGFGVWVLGWGSVSREKGGGALLAGGVILAAIGCYRVHKVKLPFGAGEIETHPQDSGGGTAKYADQVAEPDEEGQAKPQQSSEIAEDDLEDAARYYIADRALRALLTPTEPPLAGCEMHLFIYDDVEGLLLPVFETDDADSTEVEGWPPHVGVTGEAYVRKQYIRALGPAASDSTFGLDTIRQLRYRDLRAVAAAPVLNASDRCIAVLSASTEREDNQLATDDGEAALLALATGVARILVDLLKWFSDDAET